MFCSNRQSIKPRHIVFCPRLTHRLMSLITSGRAVTEPVSPVLFSTLNMFDAMMPTSFHSGFRMHECWMPVLSFRSRFFPPH